MRTVGTQRTEVNAVVTVTTAYYGADPYDSNPYYRYGYGWGAPYSYWSRYEDAVSRFQNAVESPPAGH